MPSGSRTVEINYTFYRMPTEKLLAGWAAGTPEHFQFTLKAPRRITHDAKLQRCEDLLQSFCRTRARSGRSSATLLFQLPPTFKKDVQVLARFRRAAAGRHARRGRVPPSLVVRRRDLRRPASEQHRAVRRGQRKAEHAGRNDRRLRATSGCATRAINRPTSRDGPASVRGLQGVGDVFVYFKHEEQGLGPDFARRFIEAVTLAG